MPSPQQSPQSTRRRRSFTQGRTYLNPLINKRKHKPTKLRSAITPGTILIILTGHFKGKRVVFLKQLESGLLLVTGPFKVNGVPIRRVNQVYVIATSTKIDVSNVDVSKYDDKYFEREVVKKEKTEEQFFEAEKKPTKYIAPHRKEDQKVLDEQVLKVVEADLKLYLSARFSLRSGMKPHELVF